MVVKVWASGGLREVEEDAMVEVERRGGISEYREDNAAVQAASASSAIP